MAAPDRCLVIKSFWLDKILTGEKTLEIRGCQHHFEGPVNLLESRTGRVRATATLGVPRPLTPEESVENKEAIETMRYKRPWAWPLMDVVALAEPWFVSAKARQYCPTWVPRGRWESFPADAASQAEAPPRREDVVSSLLERLRERRARAAREDAASASDDAMGDPGAASSAGPSMAPQALTKRPAADEGAVPAAPSGEAEEDPESSSSLGVRRFLEDGALASAEDSSDETERDSDADEPGESEDPDSSEEKESDVDADESDESEDPARPAMADSESEAELEDEFALTARARAAAAGIEHEQSDSDSLESGDHRDEGSAEEDVFGEVAAEDAAAAPAAINPGVAAARRRLRGKQLAPPAHLRAAAAFGGALDRAAPQRAERAVRPRPAAAARIDMLCKGCATDAEPDRVCRFSASSIGARATGQHGGRAGQQ
jgi:hypothetical protein